MNPSEADQLVSSVLGQVAPKLRAKMNGATPLIGDGAILDSVEFVTLLTGIDEMLDGRANLTDSFMEMSLLPDDQNPFHTVDTLSRHIAALVNRS
jgi:hypothetical protein